MPELDRHFRSPMVEDLQIAQAASANPLPEPETIAARRIGLLPACAMTVLTAAGCLAFYRELMVLWSTWTTDPLRSIGMLIPPVSIFLTLRVWRQLGWQLCGSWWGLTLVALAFFLALLRQKVVLLAVFANASASLIPISLPLCVYASGVILLFAGTEVSRKAWFPIGLLMLSQPVPVLTNGLIDIPLQDLSAHVARSFATWIHFAPTTPQLRLMFSPDFGMFIAPGCDGIRGAVTMGYVALILGYLKKVAWYVWIAFVSGAVLLGYVFNFLRLCVLVVYYRVALGHPGLEKIAKQADYAIGSCLFLIATFLFLWIASRRQQETPEAPNFALRVPHLLRRRNIAFKCAAFAATLLAFLCLPSFALNTGSSAKFDPNLFAERMPKRVGSFTLTRTWYEQQNGVPVVQAGAYSSPGSDEIILGAWIAPLNHIHDPESCWLARGLEPLLVTMRSYQIASGKSVELNTGFYSDGITNSIVVNGLCTPETCSQYHGSSSSKRLGFIFLDRIGAVTQADDHPVSIMIRIDRLPASETKTEVENDLQGEAQKFVAGFDPADLSRSFQ